MVQDHRMRLSRCRKLKYVWFQSEGILGLFGAIIPIIVNFAATKGFDKKVESYDIEIIALKEKADKITGN